MTASSVVQEPRSFCSLPPLSDLRFGELVAIDLASRTNGSTHGMHRYPAKFIPQIPRWAVEEFTKAGQTVLDPFAGSGTTLVEAANLRRQAVGVDIDPLACLIARAKTTAHDPERLAAIADRLRYRDLEASEPLHVPLKGVQNFEHWFSLKSWRELQELRSRILSETMTTAERDFFLVVFSSVLRLVSNADDQTQKTYVSGTLRKVPPPVVDVFSRHLERAIKAVGQLPSGISNVHCCSATDMPIVEGDVDLIITSPPYLDSVDYMYNFMLEYFWLGELLGVTDRAHFNAMRSMTIGAKNPREDVALPAALTSIIDVASIPKYRRDAAVAYFAGMASHFVEASRVLRVGGKYVLVVGNSQTVDGALPVHDALVTLAADAGLTMSNAFGYRIRRHYMKFPRKGRGGIILMDWVIVLEKSQRPRGGELIRLPMPKIHHAPEAVAN